MHNYHDSLGNFPIGAMGVRNVCARGTLPGRDARWQSPPDLAPHAFALHRAGVVANSYNFKPIFNSYQNTTAEFTLTTTRAAPPT